MPVPSPDAASASTAAPLLPLNLRRLSLTGGIESGMRRLSLSKVAPQLLDDDGQVMQTRCPDEVEPDQNAAALPLAGFNSRYWRSSAFAYDEWLNDGTRRSTAGHQVRPCWHRRLKLD